MLGDNEPLPVHAHEQDEDAKKRGPLTDVTSLTPLNWRRLLDHRRPGEDPVQAALQFVADWVDWLVNRYCLGDVIPPCWWAHGPIVEELSALHIAWNGAYGDGDASADAGLSWHERLERCIARLQKWNVERCSYGKHRPVVHQGWRTDLSWPPDPAEEADKSPPASKP